MPSLYQKKAQTGFQPQPFAENMWDAAVASDTSGTSAIGLLNRMALDPEECAGDLADKANSGSGTGIMRAAGGQVNRADEAGRVGGHCVMGHAQGKGCRAELMQKAGMEGTRAVLKEDKKRKGSVTQIETNVHRDALCFKVKTWARHKTTETVLNNGWRLAAVGGWRLAADGSRQLVGGGGWRLAVGSWWQLVAVSGGWRLAVGGP